VDPSAGAVRRSWRREMEGRRSAEEEEVGAKMATEVEF